jgi:hypothetical protein
MSENGRPNLPDLRDYHKNRVAFPQEELAKYAGKFVAFSPDGTRILASGDTPEEMEAQLVALGIPPNQVVGSYIEDGYTSRL